MAGAVYYRLGPDKMGRRDMHDSQTDHASGGVTFIFNWKTDDSDITEFGFFNKPGGRERTGICAVQSQTILDKHVKACCRHDPAQIAYRPRIRSGYELGEPGP